MSKEKTLRFKSLEVATIIDHLENTAAAFSPSWEQRYDLDADELVERPESEWKKLTKPSLMLVKDEGVYVMGNGLEPTHMMDFGALDEIGNKRFVSYARGYNPNSSDWETLREKSQSLSADDFAEHIPLDAIEWKVLEAIKCGFDLIITWAGDYYTISARKPIGNTLTDEQKSKLRDLTLRVLKEERGTA
ncbi:MAG: DUF3085 domain-containing protein [Alphaproteobacteria bacterium]